MEEAKSLQIEEKNTYERELNATIPRVRVVAGEREMSATTQFDVD